ncbi:hypothetical protein BO86DRAFT_386791 [Aspergillus japonicus CBS 114.51]|uniref:Uncharacterized protein n=1 Tax=Aspergillus japonicus CBS 114.51 TaxID=1448312 RepID=A0A8T8XB92_ASPJA|nr:hypothetical protein BO86DRAFT_386791 [Aspergillus japonicus CBS 114.51]RAH84722.1 hypothetical protein BO86DRAFT_386791 [Aspergillus japonicus CBS 114.51]
MRLKKDDLPLASSFWVGSTRAKKTCAASAVHTRTMGAPWVKLKGYQRSGRLKERDKTSDRDSAVGRCLFHAG